VRRRGRRLKVAQAIDAGDTKRKADIDKGASISDLVTKKYKDV
jgi:hypothetical protein